MWLYVCTKRKINSKGTKIASLSLPGYMHRIVSLLRQGTRRFLSQSCLDFGAFRKSCLLYNTHLDIDEKVSIHFCLKAIFPSPLVVEQILLGLLPECFWPSHNLIFVKIMIWVCGLHLNVGQQI